MSCPCEFYCRRRVTEKQPLISLAPYIPPEGQGFTTPFDKSLVLTNFAYSQQLKRPEHCLTFKKETDYRAVMD